MALPHNNRISILLGLLGILISMFIIIQGLGII